jgi:hypothetical protein
MINISHWVSHQLETVLGRFGTILIPYVSCEEGKSRGNPSSLKETILGHANASDTVVNLKTQVASQGLTNGTLISAVISHSNQRCPRVLTC